MSAVRGTDRPEGPPPTATASTDGHPSDPTPGDPTDRDITDRDTTGPQPGSPTVGPSSDHDSPDRGRRHGRELDLYEPVAQVIATDWARAHDISPVAVEITALQGSRQTGGRFTRPDIVCVEIRTYEYLPRKDLEVITFEVKRAGVADVVCVLEALAHRRAATRSYVLVHVPIDRIQPTAAGVDHTVRFARQQGIGVVTFADPRDYDTWTERCEARLVEPDPHELNAFITNQLSGAARRGIARGLR